MGRKCFPTKTWIVLCIVLYWMHALWGSTLFWHHVFSKTPSKVHFPKGCYCANRIHTLTSHQVALCSRQLCCVWNLICVVLSALKVLCDNFLSHLLLAENWVLMNGRLQIALLARMLYIAISSSILTMKKKTVFACLLQRSCRQASRLCRVYQ